MCHLIKRIDEKKITLLQVKEKVYQNTGNLRYIF